MTSEYLLNSLKRKLFLLIAIPFSLITFIKYLVDGSALSFSTNCRNWSGLFCICASQKSRKLLCNCNGLILFSIGTKNTPQNIFWAKVLIFSRISCHQKIGKNSIFSLSISVSHWRNKGIIGDPWRTFASFPSTLYPNIFNIASAGVRWVIITIISSS